MLRSFSSVVVSASLLFGSLSVSGCGAHSDALEVGAAGGAVAGAGTGAIIGAVIANGDIAASALLGGVVGIPIGIAIAALYDHNSERSVRERKTDTIKANQNEIFARQREIDSLREKVRTDGPSGNPREQDRQYQYDGETYGNYYR